MDGKGGSQSQAAMAQMYRPHFQLRYKRLERGKFVWPRAHEGALRLSAAQLAMLIEGLNWKQAIVHDEVITPRLA